MTTPPRAAIYRRISNDREGREAGVTRQQEDCLDLCARRGYQVVGDFCDNDRGASTRSRKSRPEFARMLAAVRAGEIDVIISYSMSRVTRRPAEWETLIQLVEQTGVRIETCVSGTADINTADGRAVLRTIAAWDAAEAERTAERIQRAHRQRQQHGKPNWTRRPFGHRPDGREEPAEAAAIRWAAEAILSGASQADVARTWNERETLTVTGAEWTPRLVGQVLRQERLAGLVCGNPSEHVAAVLSPATWRAMVARLDDRGRKQQRAGRIRTLLGGGLARCGVCSAPVTRRVEGGREWYACARGGHVVVDMALVDEVVLSRAAVAAAQYGVRLLPGAEGAPAELRERERAILSQIADVQAAIRAGQAVASLAPVLDDLERELAVVQRQISEADGAARNPADLLRVLANAEALSLGERRDIISRVYERIVLDRRYQDQTRDAQRVRTVFRAEVFPALAGVEVRDAVMGVGPDGYRLVPTRPGDFTPAPLV
jgi:DNA invertase Pin-like site-specific DNA recombinase